MSFQQQKKKQLSKKDKSGEGKWDKAISSLCKKINKKDDYYTTSSCAGRIALVKGLPEKAKSAFLFKTHNILPKKKECSAGTVERENRSTFAASWGILAEYSGSGKEANHVKVRRTDDRR